MLSFYFWELIQTRGGRSIETILGREDVEFSFSKLDRLEDDRNHEVKNTDCFLYITITSCQTTKETESRIEIDLLRSGFHEFFLPIGSLFKKFL